MPPEPPDIGFQPITPDIFDGLNSDFLDGPLSLLQSGPISTIFFVFKVITFLLIIGFITATIMINRQYKPHAERIEVVKGGGKPIKKKVAVDIWAKIVERAERGSEQDLAFAVIEADKLIDTVLKSSGFTGDTMAERLKNIEPHELSSIQDLWDAHKYRNRIVHDAGFEVTVEEARSMMRKYQNVLEELEVI